MTAVSALEIKLKKFQSTCHIRGMTVFARYISAAALFQSTCHIRGMTGCPPDGSCTSHISIHMPHTWHDDCRNSLNNGIDISIHMPHTWHDCLHGLKFRLLIAISIHMPHTWHDAIARVCASPCCIYFNPHATYVA